MRSRRFSLPVLTILAALAIALADPRPVLAQDQASDAANAEATQPPEPPGEAPFMRPLGRLATILGSVHFLRKLCGEPDADVWRTEMSALIAAQAPREADKRQLIASFNNGYRSFAATYRSCTKAARVAVDRYRREGAALAREIGSRYGA
ncbi:TIGR02301 family protein [Jiella sp. MQZ9-1]|uniref:TIGR02301 family protein n=1 Tax=Jiella flava TaxID=2816857 RepID=A0A939G2H8_9HYPH|nr:TIGR02301 family protein [Jiella flava]MBO0664363.1 TIGR02301 family protein [Jiella flava]MCD2472999.1 TIGR02301 family protein [Jiella flava]